MDNGKVFTMIYCIMCKIMHILIVIVYSIAASCGKKSNFFDDFQRGVAILDNPLYNPPYIS